MEQVELTENPLAGLKVQSQGRNRDGKLLVMVTLDRGEMQDYAQLVIGGIKDGDVRSFCDLAQGMIAGHLERVRGGPDLRGSGLQQAIDATYGDLLLLSVWGRN